jgi:hypothetical protein
VGTRRWLLVVLGSGTVYLVCRCPGSGGVPFASQIDRTSCTSQEVVDNLDARIFIHVPYDVLKERREVRSGYAIAGRFYSDTCFETMSPHALRSSFILIYPPRTDFDLVENK